MLERARRLIAESRFEEAFRLLEDLRRQDDRPEILYAGSLALFGLGHVYQAEEWVRSFGRATGQGPDYQYLEAYIQLHHRRLDQALLCWTEIIQKDPSQTLADQLIDRIKGDEEAVLEEIRIPANFREYIPPGPARPVRAPAWFQRKHFFWILPGLIFLAGLYGLIHYLGREQMPELLPPTHITFIPAASYKEALEKPEFLYENAGEIKADFESIQRLQEAGKPNQVLRILGKIELSNAGFEVKERATLLRSRVHFPADFDDALDVAAIQAAPYALRGAHVRWRGPVLFAGERDFLFQTSGVQVRVYLEKSASYKQGTEVEVTGVFQKILREGTIILEGKEVRGR